MLIAPQRGQDKRPQSPRSASHFRLGSKGGQRFCASETSLTHSCLRSTAGAAIIESESGFHNVPFTLANPRILVVLLPLKINNLFLCNRRRSSNALPGPFDNLRKNRRSKEGHDVSCPYGPPQKAAPTCRRARTPPRARVGPILKLRSGKSRVQKISFPDFSTFSLTKLYSVVYYMTYKVAPRR